MIFQYNLFLLFLWGFAALSVSTETCGKDLLVGTSCIIKLRTKNNEKPSEIRWVHDRNGIILHWRDGNFKTLAEGVSKEEDGSLRFQSVSLRDTGTYSFYAFNTDGTEIGAGTVEIKVYVSTETCGTDLLVGTSCIIKLRTRNNEKPSEIKWTHDRNGVILHWRDGNFKTLAEGVSKEEDGSLRFQSVSLRDTGTYSFHAFDTDGTEIGAGEVEIKVYVSTETCGKDLLVGTSCIINLRTRNNEKPYEIKWIHDRYGVILHWRDGKIKTQAEGVSKEEDGSLRFQSVSLRDTGTYSFYAFNTDGTEIGQGTVEIKVYVSTEICGKDLLVGTSCIIKLRTRNNEKPSEIKWTHDRNGVILHWRDGNFKTLAEGVSKEEDGSLTFQSVSLRDTGTYSFHAFDTDGTEIGAGEVEIKVYVSTETCGKDLLVGTSCIINLRTRNNEKPYEIKWIHDRYGVILHWRDGKIKTQAEGVSKEEDGSLRFQSVSLRDTGTYSFYAINTDGTEIGQGTVEIKVYVSTETCGKDLLVGTSCIIKLRTRNNEKPYEIKWTHDRNGVILHWRDGKIKTLAEGVSKEEDGSLRFQSVSLKDTGTYRYDTFGTDGTEIGKGEVEIKVYEKAPKPAVKISCSADGNATLTCDVGNRKDPSLTVSWYEDGKPVQNENKPQVFLPSDKVQENKMYSCEARNPVSEDKSENITVSCPSLRKMFALDFWIMGGGAV